MVVPYVIIPFGTAAQKTDRQRDRKTESQTDREIDKQTNRKIDRQTYRIRKMSDERRDERIMSP